MSVQLNIGTYQEGLLFLATAGVIVPLFRRLRVTPVIGFLAAGAALGPSGLGLLATRYPWLSAITFSDVKTMATFAEFGVVFLLFIIGLELSFERLKRMRRLVFGFGALQVFISAIVIASACMLLGLSAAASAIIGGALALSSTAIVMPVLSERKRLGTGAGRAIFAILLFQDLMVAPLLFMVTLLDQRYDAGMSANAGVAFFYAIIPALAMVAALVAFGRLFLRPLFHQVAITRSTEFFMAACLLVVIGAAVISAAAGLSMALGAFIAGLLLAETEYRREVEATIEPFKGLLLGLFFISIGAGLDFSEVARNPAMTIGVAVTLIAVKILIVLIIARALKFSPLAAQETAFLLGPGGEFAFVMLGTAIAVEAVPRVIGNQLMLAVTLSMVTIPALAWAFGLLQKAQPEPPQTYPELQPGAEGVSDTGHVIVIGYGRVGSLVGEMLKRHDVPYLAIDGDAKLVVNERKNGFPVYWGDATNLELLRKSGLEEARAIVLTMDAPRAMEIIVSTVRRERADITIVARARDAHHATILYGLGASDAIPETIEASLQLSEATLVDIGVPMGYVIASIHEKRDEYRKFLQPKGEKQAKRHQIRYARRVQEMKRLANERDPS
ncbi:MAG: cation:proton antiporter [Beijerinckiaceae bacterium]|nr:cation:proton antiporter [Beijerinckiaceae bacterium]